MPETVTKRKSRPVLIIVLAFIAIATVLLIANRDKLAQNRNGENADERLAYSYEYGALARFALVGNKLAISSSTGLQLLDGEGFALERQVYSAKNPALSASESSCVFYDVGGTALRFYSGGRLINLDTKNPIICADLGSGGFLLVGTEESGYKGSVTILDETGQEVYKWFSGSGYLLDAALSSDNRTFAALCVETSGSVVHIFDRSSEAELASISLPGELAFQLDFTSGSSKNFALLSESALRFYDAEKPDSGAVNTIDFEDMSLSAFHISEDFCAVALSRYVSGGAVTLLSFGGDGETLGSVELSFEPLSLTASGGRLLALGGGEAVVFSRNLKSVSRASAPAGFGDGVLLPDGDALLLSPYHGEKLKL
ncbi:MAG: DUF5711 family protein [Oscillospiraceae bacterium]|jgi:hypothetical protein|nr:DUF5711 family protein [Oscillospiraceae bacterium]